MNKRKVLIGSPVRMKPEILKEFLYSLEKLRKRRIQVEYYFVDNNDDLESKKVLMNFKEKYKNNVIIEESKTDEKILGDQKKQNGNEDLIWTIAKYKDRILQYGLNKSCDYVFLVDSDLILHPYTLMQLISSKKDIIAEIFWTKWKEDSSLLPQVWLYDQYGLTPLTRGEILTDEEKSKRSNNFLNTLYTPGIYQVGGLGGCILISRNAIEKGVKFSEINNISFWGEDRHFCIRAAALGFDLFVDTTYPAYHIYKEKDLDQVEAYRRGEYIQIPKEEKNDNNIQEIMKTVTEDFIRTYFNCDYRIITGFESLKYMTFNMANKYNKKQEEVVNYLIDHRIKSVVTLLEIILDSKEISDSNTKVFVNMFLEFWKDEMVYGKKCKCVLDIVSSKCKWCVDDIGFINEKDESFLGLTIKDLIENIS